MLYWLVGLSDKISVLNVFRYITFRTGGAVITALFFVFLFGQVMIDRLRSYGTVEIVPDQTMLFARDARQVDMFVIIEGSIEAYTLAGQNHEYLPQLLTSRQFPGELDLARDEDHNQAIVLQKIVGRL